VGGTPSAQLQLQRNAGAQPRLKRGALRTWPSHLKPLSHRAKLVTAAVNYCLTAYATLTVAAVKMLHCVWVPGTPTHQRRLFIEGDRVCNYLGWQVPYILLVALLAAVPAVLPLIAAWSRRPTRNDIESMRDLREYDSPHPLADDIRLGVKRALVDPYVHSAFYWEAVLMTQRLVRLEVAPSAF
jgi:hypothetical protein